MMQPASQGEVTATSRRAFLTLGVERIMPVPRIRRKRT